MTGAITRAMTETMTEAMTGDMKVLFTGGGTAGHVTPNLALIRAAQSLGWSVLYVGSGDGVEGGMVTRLGVPFRAVATGKLRRYFSWRTFLVPFKINLGVIQAILICATWKPDIVFSKGGYVAIPVIVAAWLCRVPVVSHESDVTPGLANRLTYPLCRKICVTFAETAARLPEHKLVYTGTPVRASLLQGDAGAGLAHLGLDDSKPLLLVIGGSLGARAINDQVRRVIPRLVTRFNIVHVVGPGNLVDPAGDAGSITDSYRQVEFLHEDFGDVLAAATLVVSRAGANALYELLVTRKPHLLIPLSSAASRGDQLDNAATFREKGFSRVIEEAALNDDDFLQAIDEVYADRQIIQASLAGFQAPDSVSIILNLLAATTVKP